jgi:hypothetical protein
VAFAFAFWVGVFRARVGERERLAGARGAKGAKEDAQIRDLIFSSLISYAIAIECLLRLPPLEVENYRLPTKEEGGEEVQVPLQ